MIAPQVPLASLWTASSSSWRPTRCISSRLSVVKILVGFEFINKFFYFQGGDRVQGGTGFIEQQDFRLDGNSPRDHQALGLAPESLRVLSSSRSLTSSHKAALFWAFSTMASRVWRLLMPWILRQKATFS